MNDFFVPFDHADGGLGATRGYWGAFFDYGVQDNALWLNTGGQQQMSVLLDESTGVTLMENYGLEEFEDFIGVNVMVVGELSTSKSGKPYLKPQSARHVVLYSRDQ